MPAASAEVFAAIEAGDSGALTTLLEADPGLVHIRLPDKPGETGLDRPTPLQTAAAGGHLDLVRLLIEHGAIIYETGQWGYPAVIHAAWAKQDAVVAWFLGEGAGHETMRGAPTYGIGVDINLAARQGWLEQVQAHLAYDPLAVHRRGVIGDTPLHWAGHNHHVAVVEALLAAGADVEADEIGLYGGKPLHWAAEHSPQVVNLLLAAGAQVDSRNLMPNEMEGYTPLIMCASQRNDCADCATLLLEAGADPAAVDAQGRTALDISAERGSRRVAAVVREAMGG